MHKNFSSAILFLILALTIIGTLSLLSCSQKNTKKDVGEYLFEGLGAYQRKDYAGFLSNLKKAAILAPNNPNIMYNLARAYALDGNKKAALEWLQKAIRVGYYLNPKHNDDFHSLWNTEVYKTVQKIIKAKKIPVTKSNIAFTITEKDLMPEGIAYDPVKEKFYIGSLYKRKIISINKKGVIKDFTKEQQDGLWGVAGMKVDAKHRILWVNSAVFGFMKGNKDKSYGLSGVFKYNLNNGKLIKKYVLDTRPVFHLFNDLVVNSQGDVFITDSLFGAVFRISNEKDKLELFVKPDRLTYPNGIALSQHQDYLYVVHKEGISLININTKFCALLSHSESITLCEIDGLYFYKNSLIGIQNDNWQKHVIQFFLNKDANRSLKNKNSYQVEKAQIIESGNPLFMLPTTGVLVGDAFYYIANSQLTSFNDDGTIFPMDKLHEIVILKAKL